MDTRGADPRGCYLTDISLGAIRTWWFADANLGRIAAIVPVSGTAPEPGHAAAGTPAWVFAGESDDNEGYSAGVVKAGLDAARPDDPQLRFEEVRGGGHNDAMWNAVYSRVEVYEWLLEHRSAAPFE